MLFIEKFFGPVKKTLGLVHTNKNLPQWQAITLTFFPPCKGSKIELTSDLTYISITSQQGPAR